MALLFPAILIGGPPHSGKSTLTYRLRTALIERGLAFYALRANPDGEGNWTLETAEELASELRRRTKGPWTQQFATAVSRHVTARHLPLIVDVGGMVSSETAMIAAQCTHAVLLADEPARLAPWRELAQTHGLALIADLRSALEGVQSIIDDGATLRGVITGLDRKLSSDGPCFAALCERVAQLFAYDAAELERAHLALTDLDLVINVERPIYPLPAHDPYAWRTDELAPLLGSLPPATPLGIYGRGPVWLYAALAAFCDPARCAVFDPRLGWVAPPPLTRGSVEDPARLSWETTQDRPGAVHIRLITPGIYEDEQAVAGAPVPDISGDLGVVLDGKLPNWLWAALMRTYADAPWVAVYEPRTGNAVVVRSRDSAVPLGSVRTLNAER